MHLPLRLLPGALVLALSLFAANSAAAQAVPTASRGAQLSVFGEGSIVGTDYAKSTDAGVVLGARMRFHLPRYVSPSLEARGGWVTGSDIRLETLLGGLRLESNRSTFHPYGNFLVGRGSIVFAHPTIGLNGQPYRSDDSIVFNYGGGLQYDLDQSWGIQAEYQRQDWNIGGYPHAIRFNPNAFNVGVVYRPGFRRHAPRY